MDPRLLVTLCFVSGSVLPAQNIFHGNGVPSAYIANTPAVVGQELRFDLGSPTAPGGLGAITLSGGLGPTFVPLIGQAGIDIFNPFYFVQSFFLDAAGEAGLVIPLPPGVVNASMAPFYANFLTLEAPFPTFSVSKTVRVEFANPNGWEPVGDLSSGRQWHTATALGEGPRDNVTELLIAGGATGTIFNPLPMSTAEFYDPLTRTAIALPPMSLPRAGHGAVRLQDGRVLISGGVTNNGVVTDSCEVFNPISQAFDSAPSMHAPRAAHQLTLLDDGRVLATGGAAAWQPSAPNFLAAAASAQDTSEIFNPVTNAWSVGPVMSSKRFGHTATKLLDGTVLLISGISGTQNWSTIFSPGTYPVPAYTKHCEYFDPATDSFSIWPHITGYPFPFGIVQERGFHAASLLPDGNVLVSGGFVHGSLHGYPVATDTTFRWNPTQDLWMLTQPLPAAVRMHTQVAVDGGAMITGGYTADENSWGGVGYNVFHDGDNVVALAELGRDGAAGMAEPRGGHTCTQLYDGTLLIYGGGQGVGVLSDGFVYTSSLQ